MDPMDWLENKELLLFFRRHKTEMSCMEKPQSFLSQLRDHDLVQEERYKKVSRMKSKENLKKGLYEILDWLERKRSPYIKAFWSCVFKESILNQYPTLRLLRNSLMDGSFESEVQLPEKVELEEADKEKRKELSEEEEGEEKQAKSVQEKRKLRKRNACDEEKEQAGPSSQLTLRKKSKQKLFSSPMKKGEKNDIWTWPLYKCQLPVTCGHQEGTLSRDRLSKGEKCISVGRQWFTPNEFEIFAGKKSSKNWKLSIRCMNTPLGKLIQEGHLKATTYRGCKKTKKSLFPSDHVTTEDEDEDSELEDQVSSSSTESSTAVTDEEEEDTEEPTEQQPEASHDGGKQVFKVTCGAGAGTLHQKRFASGTLGKSIRTERSWMTPVDFMTEASSQTHSSWRKDIECEGKPIGDLIEANILTIHSLLCVCRLCKPDHEDLENQKNDDECFICKAEEEEGEEEELVVCDTCPRSFHKNCHLPHVEDTILGDHCLWICTFCVYKNTKELYWDELERDAVMSRRISQWMLQCQYLLLCLCSANEGQLFVTKPTYLQRHSTEIKTPTLLGNVADKLQKKLYHTVGDFVSDIQLIFTNCASYNRNNAEFLAKLNRLEELFDGEFKSVFKITEPNFD